MRFRQWAGVSAAALAAVVLGGCGADGGAQAAPTEASPAETRQVGTAPDEPGPDDEATCTAYGDVLTILENADLGLRDGRMTTSACRCRSASSPADEPRSPVCGVPLGGGASRKPCRPFDGVGRLVTSTGTWAGDGAR